MRRGVDGRARRNGRRRPHPRYELAILRLYQFLALRLVKLLLAVGPVVLEGARVLAGVADGLSHAELPLGKPLAAPLALALVGVGIPGVVQEVVARPYLHEIPVRDLAGIQPVVNRRLGALEHARKVRLGHAPGRHHPIEHLANGRIFRQFPWHCAYLATFLIGNVQPFSKGGRKKCRFVIPTRSSREACSKRRTRPCRSRESGW